MPTRQRPRASRELVSESLTEDARRTLQILEALLALEKAVGACPAGHRRRAAVELVVSRIRRLAKASRGPKVALPSHLDIEDLCKKKVR